MKKILKSLFITILSLAVISCNKKVSEHEARLVLAKHLESRYGEPFEIGSMGIMMGRNRYYQANIIPKRYVGTPKERDKYYHAVGTVRIYEDMWGEKLGTGGDIYMTVQLNEDANAYFLPKLQELFGNQVLPILKIRTEEIINNGKDFEKILEHNKSISGSFYIEGGIYIFTRIDDLETKDKYRGKLYKLIQHMKSNNMFAQVNLGVYFLDERGLTDRFEKEIGNRLLKARYELTTADEFIAYRRGQMKELDKDFEEMTKKDIENKIDTFNRSYLREIYKKDDNKYSALYHVTIWGPKFYDMESRIHDYKKVNYDYFSELKLFNTVKMDYKEFDLERRKRNEWDGE